MRFYRLIFDNNQLELSSKNPTGLKIDFNINSYHGSKMTAPSVVRIYNYTSVFNQIDSFKDKQIILYAGLEEDPTMRVQGFSGFSSCILQGKILGSATTWNGHDTILNLAVGLTSAPSGIKQVGQINVDNPVAEQVVNIIKANLGGEKCPFIFKITEEAKQVKTNTRETIPLRPLVESANFLIFFDEFLNRFGLKLIYDASVQEFTIMKVGENANNKVHMINPIDLIGQPEYVNVGQLMVTTQLNGEYRLNDLILLPTQLPLVGSFSSIQDILPLTGDSALKIAAKGLYKIISINHIGDSRGADASQWATQMLVLAQESYQGIEAMLNEYTSKYLDPYNKFINKYF